MITFTPFRAGHLTYLQPQKFQVGEHRALVESGHAHEFERFLSLTAWRDSRCLGAAGIVPVRPHKGVAWMLLSEDVARYMLPVVRKVRRVLRATEYKRVELQVHAEFVEGQKFARLIGAKLETPEPMKYSGADGSDEYLFAWTMER